MATKSFYQDIIIDNPEDAARLEAFLEEEPHVDMEGFKPAPFNDPEFISHLCEKIRSKR